METDDFFYRLFKQLPQTLFELIGMPAERSRGYRFDSVELKKSVRIDGLCLPANPDAPILFVEVQFQRLATFYANLFTKVFAYLEENNPAQDWIAIPIFVSRAAEPRELAPYEPLLQSAKVKRIYLKDHPIPDDAAPGLAILQLVSAPLIRTPELVARIVERTSANVPGATSVPNVIELVEELLIRRFSGLRREEVRTMFGLTDLRKTRVWQEAHEEGIEQGLEKGIEQGLEQGESRYKTKMVHRCLAKGMTTKEIADLLEISVKEVRRLTRQSVE